MRRSELISAAFAAIFVFGITAASAQQVLTPGQVMRGEHRRSSPAYPGTVSSNYPTGLQFECYAIDTVSGSHWQIEVTAGSRNAIAIGRGPTCPDARAVGWLHSVTVGDGVWRPTTNLRFTSGGGRYLLSVTSSYYEGFKIRAIETSGGEGYVVLPAGRRPYRDPPAGTASTITRTVSASLTPGEVLRDCDKCPELVVLPSGNFMMGSNDLEEGRDANEGPLHRVTIGRPFAMGRYEVTFDQYDACVAEGGCDPVIDSGWGRGRRPVINVTYLHAQRYVSWLSETTGHAYFIPSEAEWEYAARAGSDTPWNTGTAIITADANFLNTFNKTVPAGSYPPNAFGLHDMHGNVWEWTQDCIDTGYLGVPNDGSAATSGDCVSKRIVRGGSHISAHDRLRSATREGVMENGYNNTVGFRVARAL